MSATTPLDRAMALYVKLACRKERERADYYNGLLARAWSDNRKIRERQARQAQETLELAEKQAREIFGAVVRGEIEP